MSQCSTWIDIFSRATRAQILWIEALRSVKGLEMYRRSSALQPTVNPYVDRQDTITDDAAGQGSIRTRQGMTFTGGTKTNDNTWEIGGIKYIRQGSRLAIANNGNAGDIKGIKCYQVSSTLSFNLLVKHQSWYLKTSCHARATHLYRRTVTSNSVALYIQI